MIRRLTIFFFTIVAMLTGVNFVCQAQTQSLMTRHVREATFSGQAPFVKKLPATQSLRLDIVLPIRNQSDLDSFLRELYDPSSPFFHQFLSVKEFTERFGPTQENYDALLQFAKTHGLSVVGGSRDAMDVQLAGSVSAIESAFHVTMNVYQHPIEDRTFYGPDREPTVDLPFQLWHISGLDNFSTPHPLYHHRDLTVKRNATTGSGPSASFLGSDMRAAYYGTGSLTGSGQNIGLLEYAGFDIADVNTYYTNAKQTRTAAVTGISTDGTSINCSGSCDDTEQTLDITQALGMAPGVTTVYVYVGSTDTALLGSMSSHTPLPLQLSSSWTWTPADPSTDDPYFEKMATQGQTIFQAAGDSGNWKTSTYPSEDAHVVCVGGTDLSTASAGGPWSSESTWVDGGGGYYAKDDILIPSYQQTAGVINSSNKGSTTYRNGPDVSANANFTFYVCADQTTCTANEYGGTSFAAPMWAGYLALTNQQAAASGDAAPGFINPAVYGIGLSSSYDTDFHDITSGSNGFSAVTGYDLATGWGSPNGAALINALAPTSKTPNFTISASPASVSVVQGNSGTSTITTAVSGGFSAAITLSASGQPSGVTVGFGTNPIAAPGSGSSLATFTVASTTATGTYSIVITGTGGGVTQTTSVSLTVTAPVAGSFTLSASPTSLTVDRSAKGTSTITIHPANGFTGSVTLSATGMGSGVTAAFGTNPTTSTSVLTFTASSSATTGTHTITVTGKSGSLTETTTISLRIRR